MVFYSSELMSRQSEQRVYRGPPERTLAIYAREFRRIAASRDAPNLVLLAWLVLANPDPTLTLILTLTLTLTLTPRCSRRRTSPSWTATSLLPSPRAAGCGSCSRPLTRWRL